MSDGKLIFRSMFSRFFYIYIQLYIEFIQAFQNPSKSCNGMNVVLFFAESTAGTNDTNGISFLDMHEIARVKHSISSPVQHSYIAHRSAPDCKELLKTSVDSLIHFCHNALGMKTAMVHFSTKTFNSMINEEGPKDSGRLPEEPMKYPEEPMRYPEELRDRRLHPKYPFRTHRIPHNTVDDTIPSYSKMKGRSPIRNIITSPEHREVFKIRVKRQDNGEDDKLGDIVDISLGKDKDRKPWDVLDIMSHVRYSFFGKLFENVKDIASNEETNLLDQLGKMKQDPGLFDTVKATLISLQESPGPEGFLMIIFGGHFSEISHKHSPLVQSLKHIIESTDPESTLIILTGACPDIQSASDDFIVIKEAVANHLVNAVPVFVKGPKSEKLAQCKQLYDIPLTVKVILEEASPNFGEIIRSSRPKRSIFDKSPSDRPSVQKATILIYYTLIIIYF